MAQGLAVLPAFLEELSSVPGTRVTITQVLRRLQPYPQASAFMCTSPCLLIIIKNNNTYLLKNRIKIE